MNLSRQGMDGDEGFMITFSSRITCCCLHILADDDDGQQHQLQERLRNPTHDDNRAMRVNRRRKRDKGKQGERIRTPHGANRFRNGYGDPGIETTKQALTMDRFLNMVG